MLKEKAIQYAEDVISGKEITTKYVKIQCEWFLKDLERQSQEDFAYFFDEDAIKKVSGLLSIMNYATGIGIVGQDILSGLVGFQAFFLANIFGWKLKNDKKKSRFQDSTLFIPRKNSKTFLCAVIIIILLLTEDKYSEMYSICVDRELAGETKKAIGQIINASPHLTRHFTIPKTLSGKVVCHLTSSFYQARTSDATRNNAIRPSCVVADEVAAYKDYSNLNAMKSGMLNTRNPLRFKLTTAYANSQSIMLEELDYIKKVFDGYIKDERMFALLYYADQEHLWTDYGLYQSNPLRIEDNYEEIRKNRQVALEKPKEREEYLCKHVNWFLPSNSGESFITRDELVKCKIKDFDWSGKCCWIGLDLALTNDNCSYTMVTEIDLEIYADSYAFVPRDRIEEKNRNEKINYWDYIKAENPKVFACGDMTVDYNFIEQMIAEIESKHKVTIMGIAFDRYNALASAQHLEQKFGYKVVEVKQHSSVLHPPIKLVKEQILSEKFHYLENELFEINMINARQIEDHNKNLYISKKKSNGKIDMAISLINAVYLLQQDVIFNPESDWSIQIL